MSFVPDVFLITSVINTGNNPWSYTSVRSVYSAQERFEQTLETIRSIREFSAAGSKIVLVECSDLSAEMTAALESRVDLFHQMYHNEALRSVCLQTSKKGYGEAVQTATAIRIIKESGMEFRRIFKISGRYWLRSTFSADLFSDEKFTFKEPYGTSYSTVLYCVPACLFNEYERLIHECCTIYKNSHEPFGWECLFPPKCYPIQVIPRLHVGGKVAITVDEEFDG